MEGAGSIWNKNSWHWEEKNYNKWSQDWFKDHYLALSLECFAPYLTKLNVVEVDKLKGEASITIRKQKQIHVFISEAELKFLAVKSDGEEPQADGVIKIHEFCNDDDDVELSITINKKNDDVPAEFLEKLRQAINTTLKSKINHLKEVFMEEFKAKEADRQRIEDDKRKRAEEEEQMKKA